MNEKKLNMHPMDGHRERLRAKYLKAGHDGMLDYEKLELLLTFVIARRDVKPIAKEMMAKFGCISRILDASEEELMAVNGIGRSAFILLRLLKGLCSDYLYERIENKEIVESSEDVLKYAKMKLAGLKNEVFMVIYLNTRNEILGSEILVEGTVDQLFIHPRQLMERALSMSARGIVLIHNHPSGTAKPSPADLALTSAIKVAADAMRIDVVDHLIVTHNACYSIEAERQVAMTPPPLAASMRAAEQKTVPAGAEQKTKSSQEKEADAFVELARLAALRELDRGNGPSHVKPQTKNRDFQISEIRNLPRKNIARRTQKDGENA